MNIVGALMLISNSAYFGDYPSVGVNAAHNNKSPV